MNRKFYRCCIQLNRRLFFTIWYDNDYSGFHLTEGGLIPAFDCLSELNKYAAEIGIRLYEGYDYITYDFDVVVEWLKAPKGKTIKCSEFLNLYNRAGDFRNALAEQNLDILDKSYPVILEKLFWGCNNPSVTPPGKKFTPVWSKAQVREMRRAMRESLLVFEKNLYLMSCESKTLS